MIVVEYNHRNRLFADPHDDSRFKSIHVLDISDDDR